MATFPVKIRADGTVPSQDQRKRLSKDRQDQVRWSTAEKSGPWTVRFRDRTPFGSFTYEVSPGKPVKSGPANGNVGDRFKYDIEDEDGQVTQDPEIIIDA
jgi:hypothetical protein